MAPKKEFEPKPSSKQEKNKPKGGKAKDEKRAAGQSEAGSQDGGAVRQVAAEWTAETCGVASMAVVSDGRTQ